jgi:hypothetical protein
VKAKLPLTGLSNPAMRRIRTIKAAEGTTFPDM